MIRYSKSVPLVALIFACGCNSILNGWLTPIELGSFSRESTMEIRGSLSIQDTPRGVRGATEPTPEDLQPTTEEYRVKPGDVVNIFINELRARNVEDAQQSVVDEQGYIRLRILKRIYVSGMTALELEDKLVEILEERDILYDAEVLVQFAARRGLTYTIFGNETLAVRLNRGPGVFPIPRPDFRLLDALSVSGGLSELVSEIYVFRNEPADTTTKPGEEGPDESPEAEENLQESEDEPPPLPQSSGVSDGLLISHTVLSASRASRMALQQTADESQQQQPEPPAEPDDEEVDTDIQEIIDLMLSEPAAVPAPDVVDAQVPPQDEPTEDQTQPAEPQEAAGEEATDEVPDAATAPTKWVFLNGEWIEVEQETGEQAAAPPAPDTGEEDSGTPAIDWEQIAQEDQQQRIIRINADGLRQGDPRYNIVVRAGDVIRLFSGDSGFYYMTGHVRRPGVFAFRQGGAVTLKNAIAASAGLDALGWPDRVTVYRRIGEREQMIQVNLDRIYAGLEPDFYLKKDDIVNVGTHPIAPFLFQLRSFTIPQMGGSITYFYRFVRQETEFSTTNLDAPSTPGLFP